MPQTPIQAHRTDPGGRSAAAAERLREARDAGMKVSRVHVSWEELEPTPKSFDLESLVTAFDAVPPSDAILLLIETVDSDGCSLPSDLIVPGKPYALSQGRCERFPVESGYERGAEDTHESFVNGMQL